MCDVSNDIKGGSREYHQRLSHRYQRLLMFISRVDKSAGGGQTQLISIDLGLWLPPLRVKVFPGRLLTDYCSTRIASPDRR